MKKPEQFLDPVNEEVLAHTSFRVDLRKAIEARVIIRCFDEEGSEWEFNDVRKFKLIKTGRTRNG